MPRKDKNLTVYVPRYGTVIGLPDKCIPITNSERTSLPCKRKWLFKFGDFLKNREFVKPLEYGTAWHACIEDVHLWWKENDGAEYPGDGSSCVWCKDSRLDEHCKYCNSTGLGPASTIMREAEIEAEQSPYEGANDEEVREIRQKMYETLIRALDGYFRYWGRSCPDNLEVVGVELELAAPIVTSGGSRFTPTTYLKGDSRLGYEVAGSGDKDDSTLTSVNWPWYQCVKLDALFYCKKTGGLWVYEAKSAASTERRIHNISVDPQVHGYCWALRSCVQRGLLNHLHEGINKNTKVLGYIYDVASSSPQKPPELLAPKPVKKVDENGEYLMSGKRFVYETDEKGEKILKSPGLSRRASCPSWVYEGMIQKHGFDLADYEDTLDKLRTTVDVKLYRRYTGTQGEEGADRYRAEIYGIGRDLAEMKRRAVTSVTEEERFTFFPRQPVCMMTGCAFRGPCMQDGEIVRTNYDSSERVVWKVTSDEEEIIEW